ncbi:MAG: DUF3570 domain-containing protein [Woeseia sp.]
MKESKRNTVAQSVAMATCTLLGTAGNQPVHAQEEPVWEFNTALLYYGENDDRVRDISATVSARRLFSDDRILNVGLTVDALTGATPSGATPLDGVQTFTRASGQSAFDVPAGNYPLDDTFLDTRYALTAAWQQPIGRLYQGSVGVSFSKEFDYTHLGANLGLSRDFDKRNTTFSIGVSFARDDVDPIGGTPIGLTPMLDVGDLSNRRASESKDVVDLLLGVTRVINEKFLIQLNYSFSEASGYLNDPYKILSLVDPLSGDTIPRIPAPGAEGPSHEFRYENRPDSRTKQSIFGKGKYFLDGKVLDLSYRYMTDDWEIDSHTLNAKLRFPLGESSYVEPHIRYYTQTAADFYRASLTAGAPLPGFASADYRLGDFDAVTVGVRYGWTTENGHDFSLRLEYYSQNGNVPPDQLIGNQLQRDLYPGLDAVILNFGYRFGR